MTGFNYNPKKVGSDYRDKLEDQLDDPVDFGSLDFLEDVDTAKSDAEYAKTRELAASLTAQAAASKLEADSVEYEGPKLREKALNALSIGLMAYASNNPGESAARMIQQLQDVEMARGIA